MSAGAAVITALPSSLMIETVALKAVAANSATSGTTTVSRSSGTMTMFSPSFVFPTRLIWSRKRIPVESAAVWMRSWVCSVK